MKIQELRIGNLVTFQGQVMRVLSLSENKVTVRDKHENHRITLIAHANDIKAIKITKNWALRLGFYKDSNMLFSKVTKSIVFTLKFDIKDDTFYAYEYRGLFLPHIKVQHIHQLQNLLFTLTGKELEIKEK